MIDYIVTKQIGDKKHTFVVRGNNLWELMMEAKKLSFNYIPHCGLCESERLYWSAYETKIDKFKYVKLVCMNCKASLTFGNKKEDPDTYYPRRNEKKEYDWKAYEAPTTTEKPQAEQQPEPKDYDDLPF